MIVLKCNLILSKSKDAILIGNISTQLKTTVRLYPPAQLRYASGGAPCSSDSVHLDVDFETRSVVLQLRADVVLEQVSDPVELHDIFRLAL